MQVVCPMCGTSHGNRALKRVKTDAGYYIRIGSERACDRLIREYNMNKCFAHIQGTGRAGFQEVEEIDAQDPRAKPFVGPMKRLMLMAIEHYIQIGVIDPSEVQAKLEEIEEAS